jgi:hypothetical protein
MGTGTWAVQTVMDAVMTWNYDVEHPELRALYEKAKREQWNATTQLPWTQNVDPEDIILDDDINPNVALLRDSDLWRRMTPKEQTRLRYETLAWNLSQFLHGEQLAIFVAGQLAAAVPWIDAKLYGSTQVVDEARHSEVFYRYLHEKLEHEYPLSDTTRGIFESILHESRWDLKYLGLQVVLEGLAMGFSPGCIRRLGNPCSKSCSALCARMRRVILPLVSYRCAMRTRRCSPRPSAASVKTMRLRSVRSCGAAPILRKPGKPWGSRSTSAAGLWGKQRGGARRNCPLSRV